MEIKSSKLRELSAFLAEEYIEYDMSISKAHNSIVKCTIDSYEFSQQICQWLQNSNISYTLSDN